MHQPEPEPLDNVEQDLTRGLAGCTPAQRALFATLRVEPETLPCLRDGISGPVWIVARVADRVIWYEEVHEAFELHRPDPDSVLRPTSFGAFELSHILHDLLEDPDRASAGPATQPAEQPRRAYRVAPVLAALSGLSALAGWLFELYAWRYLPPLPGPPGMANGLAYGMGHVLFSTCAGFMLLASLLFWRELRWRHALYLLVGLGYVVFVRWTHSQLGG